MAVGHSVPREQSAIPWSAAQAILQLSGDYRSPWLRLTYILMRFIFISSAADLRGADRAFMTLALPLLLKLAGPPSRRS